MATAARSVSGASMSMSNSSWTFFCPSAARNRQKAVTEREGGKRGERSPPGPRGARSEPPSPPHEARFANDSPGRGARPRQNRPRPDIDVCKRAELQRTVSEPHARAARFLRLGPAMQTRGKTPAAPPSSPVISRSDGSDRAAESGAAAAAGLSHGHCASGCTSRANEIRSRDEGSWCYHGHDRPVPTV